MGALRHITEKGFLVRPVGSDRLAVFPEDRITPEIRQWVIAHKLELLQELRDTCRVWRVIVDQKPLTIICPEAQSYEQTIAGLTRRFGPGRVSALEAKNDY